jgi:two-component system response regulator
MSDQLPVEILLAEDNPQDLQLTLRAFQKANFANRIHVARDGEEVLDFIAHTLSTPSRPRLILLDLKLPKVDGLEVLRRLKGNPATRTIPIVMLTSSNEQRDVVESYQLGVNSYIVKPVNFEQFAHTVRDLGFYWMLHNQLPVAP